MLLLSIGLRQRILYFPFFAYWGPYHQLSQAVFSVVLLSLFCLLEIRNQGEFAFGAKIYMIQCNSVTQVNERIREVYRSSSNRSVRDFAKIIFRIFRDFVRI